MNKKFFTAALIGSAILAFAGGKKDPVLMTIDGKDVKLSEFEYLYHKNNSQQMSPISFDEYVDMFVDYKLKVAEAMALGVDTTAKFTAEFRKFNNELAMPYLRDSAVTEALVLEAYDHIGNEVNVSHIMMAFEDKEGNDNSARLDSIRRAILAGETTFEQAAAKYSVDTQSARRGGHMGWLSAGRVPYPFEEAAYSTPVGEISEVVNSGVGYHLVKPLGKRQPAGEVNAAHILRLTQGKTQAEREAQKALIDSLYNVAIAGADFADLATRFSEDPGSASKGGDLGYFGQGRMVAEFDSTAFAMKVGEISKPFATSYGYHIIFKKDQRAPKEPSVAEARPEIMRQMERDGRAQKPIDATLDKMAAQSKSEINPALEKNLTAYFAKAGITTCDSAAIAKMISCPVVAYTIDGKKTTVGEVLKRSKLTPGYNLSEVPGVIEGKVKTAFRAGMLTYAREYIYENNAEYRNLSNEYRDGILLFEVANTKVWERATKDTLGLNEYFQANKDKYAWNKPKFKSYVIFATNDSTLNKVHAYTDKIDPATISNDAFVKDLKDKFGKDIRVERVIAAQGENAITDYLAFGGEKPDAKNSRWKFYYAYGSKMLNAPEDVADVRGQVVSDYQAQLEKEWLEALHKTYKVKINKKVLKQAK